jgi:hypothetical protein
MHGPGLKLSCEMTQDGPASGQQNDTAGFPVETVNCAETIAATQAGGFPEAGIGLQAVCDERTKVPARAVVNTYTGRFVHRNPAASGCENFERSSVG